MPQSFLLPLADFVKATPDFDPRPLAAVRLVFATTNAGTVISVHLGVTTPKT